MVNVNGKRVAAGKVNMFNKAWRSARVMMQGPRKEKTLGSTNDCTWQDNMSSGRKSNQFGDQ